MIEVRTIDLNFRDFPGLIASYIVQHEKGFLLIESGPGSTIDSLLRGLKTNGCQLSEITDIFVTHIHLDHAGGAGWLARETGAVVHVHEIGYRHLKDPSRLMTSAARIYGDQMDTLWGEMIPIPTNQLNALNDQALIDVGGVKIQAHDTPGHAAHHMAFTIEDICFCGDVGGIRLAGPRHILLPMPPPEFHLETWIASWRKLAALGIRRIAPTHFGIYEDGKAHIALLGQTLADTADWINTHAPAAHLEQLEIELSIWMADRANKSGLSPEQHQTYETSNASVTSAGGIFRYWNKYRTEEGRHNG